MLNAMRQCLRCNQRMFVDEERLEIKDSDGIKLEVNHYSSEKPWLFGVTIKNAEKLGEVKVAICRHCGYLETYLADTSKIPHN